MKIKDLFDVKYGVNLELINCDIIDRNEKDGVNFVARTCENNGVVAYVKRIDGIEPQPAGTLSCASGGSVLSTFLQNEPFYSGRDLYILTPKKEMSIAEKLYWCTCIRFNAYRFSYGRQANKSLPNINLPDTIPDWVKNFTIHPITAQNTSADLKLNTDAWKEFTIGEFFTIVRGKRIVRDIDYFSERTQEYKYPVITSTKQNNGVDGFYFDKNCNGNTLVAGGEASGMFTTYQSRECWVMDRARIFKPRKNIKMNKYIGLFLVAIMNRNQYKYSYGRSANPNDISELILKLPAKLNGLPDWDYMENCIKLLPYSNKI